MFKLLILGIAVAGASACSSSGSNSAAATNPVVGKASTKTSCPTDISSGASHGISALPSSSANPYKNNFCKYSSLTAPNGKKVHFYAQNLISNEQIVRAKNILSFYLADVSGSTYGEDKSAVFNKMADNNATLIMMNGSDDGNPPADGQTLYQTENIIPGTMAYLKNSPRDAAYEEILHLMHDTGIGVDGANTYPGVLPAYQTEIRAATNNAVPNSIVTGGKGIWASPALDWLRELKTENSLSQEYLASVIDTYYGLAGQSTEGGSNDLYVPQTRAEIKAKDPMGWALVGNNSPRKFFSEYVTYTARVDSTFTGTFSLSFDADTKYTHKSQYLLNAQLLGTLNTGLTGNAQNNVLKGNQGNNVITGGAGIDTAVFSGKMNEYNISSTGDVTTIIDTVQNRDGTDTLKEIEKVKYSDQVVNI